MAAFYNDFGKVVIKWNCSAEMRCNAFYLHLVLSGCDKKKNEEKYNSCHTICLLSGRKSARARWYGIGPEEGVSCLPGQSI